MAIMSSDYCVSYKNGKINATFKAKLSFLDENFPNETAQNQKKEIRKRIDYDLRNNYDVTDYSGKKDIATYLIDNGAEPPPQHNLKTAYFWKNGIRIYINSSNRNMSLSISANGNKRMLDEEIINLKELNHFILTGEYNYKLFWQNTNFNKNK